MKRPPGQFQGDPAPLDYDTLFSRNYGIFSREEQDGIRNLRVVILGDSGIGETVSIILARSGVERFVLAGRDIYVPSDAGRQIGCFESSIGKSKLRVMRRMILGINPYAEVALVERLPAGGELERLVSKGDLLLPAVDDLAYSVLAFRAARRLGHPAVLALPSGSMGWVSVFGPTTPSVEEVFGIPKLDCDGLRAVMRTKEYRCAQYNLLTSGNWRAEWFLGYFEGTYPLPLICPVAWMVASLGALEILKWASRKWRPMEAPRCWYLRKGKVSASRFSLTLRAHRKLGWLLFGGPKGLKTHRLAHLFWKVMLRRLGKASP